MFVHIFGERRFSEQFPIWGSLWLSENCRNSPGVTLLKIDRHNFMFTTGERQGDFLRGIFIFKLKVSGILYSKQYFCCISSLIVCCDQTFWSQFIDFKSVQLFIYIPQSKLTCTDFFSGAIRVVFTYLTRVK